MKPQPRPIASTDLLLPLLIMLPLIWVFLPGGLPHTADGQVHFIRSAEMVHAWQAGLPVPRWSANLGYGYGIPLFVYAPPLPYFLTAFFHLTGLPLDAAMKGMLLVGIVIAGYGAYFLSRHTLGPGWPGPISAAAYLYAPIRLRELFIQGNAGQFMAWAFLPLACWGLIRLYQSGQKRYGLILALAFTGTSLSHHVVALLLALLLAGLTIALFLAERDVGRAVQAMLSGLLGLGLSAWFWLPALLEGEYIALNRIVASDFRSRFISLAELVALSPPLDSSAINPYFPPTLGTVQVDLAIIGLIGLLIALISRRRGRASDLPLTIGLFFAAFSLFGAFMALAPSEPIWSRLPFVDLFEFPTRWHGVTLVGLGWLAGLAIHSCKRGRQSAALVALLLLLGSALVNLYPQRLPEQHYKFAPADVVRYEVDSGAVGTTSLGEFNPIWAGDDFGPGPITQDYLAGRPIQRIDPQSLPPGGRLTAQSSQVQGHTFALHLPVETRLRLNLLYFPGWQARLNDRPIAVEPQPGSGLIMVTLPAGKHRLSLRFTKTPLRLIADWISLITWAGVIILAGYRLFRQPGRLRLSLDRSQAGSTVWPLALSVVFIIGLHGLKPDWFRLASPLDQARPAEQAVRVDFGQQIRLIGLDLPAEVVEPGQTIAVVAYWRVLEALETDYAVFLHLDAPDGRTVATVDQFHPTEIPTSHWPPSLYLRNPLRLTAPAEAAPIRYQLRLGLYDNQTGQPLPAMPAGQPQAAYDLGPIWLADPAAPKASRTYLARFGPHIVLTEAGYSRADPAVTLRWQTAAPLHEEYSIFVHLLDEQGRLIGQLDGLPYQNQYPTSAWRAGQSIADIRPISDAVADGRQINRLAIGLYHPGSGDRLPALDAQDRPLPDNAWLLPVE